MPAVADTESLLRRSVCVDPDDDTPRLVYADYLEERGRGEHAAFVRGQVAAYNDKKRRRHGALVFARAGYRHGARYGKFKSLQHAARPWRGCLPDFLRDDVPLGALRHLLWVRFERGLLDAFGCRLAHYVADKSPLPKLFSRHPIRAVDLVDASPDLVWVNHDEDDWPGSGRHVWRGTDRPRGLDGCMLYEEYLGSRLFPYLKGGDWNLRMNTKSYYEAEDAYADLRQAAVALGRRTCRIAIKRRPESKG